MGKRETLQKQNKLYSITHRFSQETGPWRGAYKHDRLRGTLPVALYPTFKITGPHFTLDLADDLQEFPPQDLTLRFRLQDWVDGDQVRFLLNDESLIDPTINYCHHGDSNPISDVSNAAWHNFNIDPAKTPPGSHRIEVILLNRHPQLACDLVLTDIELVVNYC